MHRQRERVRRECGARAYGASSEARQLRNRNVLDRERIIIRTDTSSEREQNFEDGKQRAAEQIEILAALTLSIGSTRDCITSG